MLLELQLDRILAEAPPAVPWQHDHETGDDVVDVAEVGGPFWWAQLHAWAENIKEWGCVHCGVEAVAFAHAIHDLKNVELGKPVMFPNDLVETADRMVKAARGAHGHGGAIAAMPQGTSMRRFTMHRPNIPEGTHDENQANPSDQPQFEGIVFSDGRTVLHWLTAKQSVAVWDSFEDMMAVHGHPEFGSKITWHDAAAEVAQVPMHMVGTNLETLLSLLLKDEGLGIEDDEVERIVSRIADHVRPSDFLDLNDGTQFNRDRPELRPTTTAVSAQSDLIGQVLKSLPVGLGIGFGFKIVDKIAEVLSGLGSDAEQEDDDMDPLDFSRVPVTGAVMAAVDVAPIPIFIVKKGADVKPGFLITQPQSGGGIDLRIVRQGAEFLEDVLTINVPAVSDARKLARNLNAHAREAKERQGAPPEDIGSDDPPVTAKEIEELATTATAT